MWAPVLESLSLPLLDELPLSNAGRILDAGGDATAGDLRLHLGRPGSNYLLVITSRTGG